METIERHRVLCDVRDCPGYQCAHVANELASLTARLTVLAGALDAIAALAPRLTNDPWAVLKEIESTARAALGAERA